MKRYAGIPCAHAKTTYASSIMNELTHEKMRLKFVPVAYFSDVASKTTMRTNDHSVSTSTQACSNHHTWGGPNVAGLT